MYSNKFSYMNWRVEKGGRKVGMSNLERKAIFLDIDGTLIGKGDTPSKYDVEQLVKARERGHMIFLNTGRSYAFIQESLRTAPYIDGIIAGGGAHILLNGKTIYHKTISEDILCEVSALYLRLGKWCQFEGEKENYRTIPQDGFKTVKSPDDFRTCYKKAQITKITVEGMLSDEERKILHPWFFLYKMKGYSEGIIRGESKTLGIKRILDAVNIPIENSIGIGDSANDIEMIMNVGYGIAMSNAVTELKQIAKATTDNCYCNGVGKAICKYVLNEDYSQKG